MTFLQDQISMALIDQTQINSYKFQIKKSLTRYYHLPTYPDKSRGLSLNWVNKMRGTKSFESSNRCLSSHTIQSKDTSILGVRKLISESAPLKEGIPWDYQFSVLMELGARLDHLPERWSNGQRFYLLPPVGVSIKAQYVEQVLRMFRVRVQVLDDPSTKSGQKKVLSLDLVSYSEDDAPFFHLNDEVLTLCGGRI